MYQLPNKPKGRNLDFLTSYHKELGKLYNYENDCDSMNARGLAESFIYNFKDDLPDNKKNSCYCYLLGKLWACHDYLEGDEE